MIVWIEIYLQYSEHNKTDSLKYDDTQLSSNFATTWSLWDRIYGKH